MKKRIFMVAAVFLAAVIFYSYVDIATTILARANYSDEAIEAIKINVEPEDKLGEIAAASLDSIFTSQMDKSSSNDEFKYIAIDAEAFHELSNSDKQYLINYFNKYNDKVIYASKDNLKKLFLYNPLSKSYKGGVLLSVNEIIELSKDRAVLQVFYHVNKYEGAGYKCTLSYLNDRWEVQSVEMNYLP